MNKRSARRGIAPLHLQCKPGFVAARLVIGYRDRCANGHSGTEWQLQLPPHGDSVWAVARVHAETDDYCLCAAHVRSGNLTERHTGHQLQSDDYR